MWWGGMESQSLHPNPSRRCIASHRIWRWSDLRKQLSSKTYCAGGDGHAAADEHAHADQHATADEHGDARPAADRHADGDARAAATAGAGGSEVRSQRQLSLFLLAAGAAGERVHGVDRAGLRAGGGGASDAGGSASLRRGQLGIPSLQFAVLGERALRAGAGRRGTLAEQREQLSPGAVAGAAADGQAADVSAADRSTSHCRATPRGLPLLHRISSVQCRGPVSRTGAPLPQDLLGRYEHLLELWSGLYGMVSTYYQAVFYRI